MLHLVMYNKWKLWSKEFYNAVKKMGENLWTYEGSIVNFYGMPYSTRMTVVRLPNNELWIHSPEKLNSELQRELASLGEVKYLISPNKLHHLFLEEWIKAYPHSKCYASPGLAQKRQDTKFTKDLENSAEDEWSNEIAQIIFKGSPVMEEVVFFHFSSKTLILTDLIENFNPQAFNGWQRMLAKLTGILSPNGKTPIDWRVSFMFGKNKARKSLASMAQWGPVNIIVSHGECIIGDGEKFLSRSF